MGLAQWWDRIRADFGVPDRILNNLPSDINTDYRHCFKPWPLLHFTSEKLLKWDPFHSTPSAL